MNDKILEELLQETKMIRMLLLLNIVESGVKQGVIADYLGVSEATVSRMLSKRKKSNKLVG